MTSTEIPPPMTDPPADGAVDGFMRKLFGRSWRTGLASRALWALGLANVIVIAVHPADPRWLAVVGSLVTFASAAGMSAAKDDKVTGVPK